MILPVCLNDFLSLFCFFQLLFDAFLIQKCQDWRFNYSYFETWVGADGDVGGDTRLFGFFTAGDKTISRDFPWKIKS